MPLWSVLPRWEPYAQRPKRAAIMRSWLPLPAMVANMARPPIKDTHTDHRGYQDTVHLTSILWLNFPFVTAKSIQVNAKTTEQEKGHGSSHLGKPIFIHLSYPLNLPWSPI